MKPGRNAIYHARAVLEAYQAPMAWAYRTGSSRWSVGEDLFGVFDVLVARDACRPLAVQVTTMGKRAPHANATRRRKKIERQFLRHFRIACPFVVEVWAWLPRRHFLVWRWNDRDRAWERGEPMLSPRLKARESDTPGKASA